MVRVSPPSLRPQMHLFLQSASATSRPREATETWKRTPFWRPVPKRASASRWHRIVLDSLWLALLAKRLSSDISTSLRRIRRARMEAALVAVVQEQWGRIGDPRRASGSVSQAWWLAHKRGCPWRISANASNKKCGRSRRHTRRRFCARSSGTSNGGNGGCGQQLLLLPYS